MPVSRTTISVTNPMENRMRYVCLIYDDEKLLESMPKEETDAFMGEYFSFSDELTKSGKYIAGEALQPISTATSLRMRNGKLSTTDGPFAETRSSLAASTSSTRAISTKRFRLRQRFPRSRRESSRSDRSWTSVSSNTG